MITSILKIRLTQKGIFLLFYSRGLSSYIIGPTIEERLSADLSCCLANFVVGVIVLMWTVARSLILTALLLSLATSDFFFVAVERWHFARDILLIITDTTAMKVGISGILLV